MSFRATKWALAQQVGSSAAKLLLALIADYADDQDFSAFPAQETLAKQAHCSRRQVGRLLKQLEAGGFIARFRRGRGLSHKIVLQVKECDVVSRGFVRRSRCSIGQAVMAMKLGGG